MTLPLVLEQTSRFYYFAVPLAAPIIALAVVGVTVDLFQSRFRSARSLVALLAAVLPLWFIFCNVGWQFRVDRDGIELSAPLNPFEGAGRIAWGDLRSVGFRVQSTRGGETTFVEFESAGTSLDLGALPGVPTSYWPVLLEAIKANAPHARIEGAFERWIKIVAEDSKASGSAWVWRHYVVR